MHVVRKLLRGNAGSGFVVPALAVLGFMVPGLAQARDIHATPETYTSHLSALEPGDRLLLAPGLYRRGLRLHGVNGTPAAPIAIVGPAGGERARFLARNGANTVSLRDVSHLVIDALDLDGLKRNADAVKAESESRYAHHVTLSRLRITGHDADQQIVGISIQSPAWDWQIRDCEILGAGTGLYLGRSDGSAGLVGGVIERNVIRDTIGYNLQIKHQTQRPAAPGMPEGRRLILVRQNVFSKRTGSAVGSQARPNVLVGHFPRSGAGAEDMHVIERNVFYENRAEALLQAEGNVALYNNVFVNSSGPAVVIAPHNARPRRLAVFNNTILATGAGLSISGIESGFSPAVIGNAVFAQGANRGWHRAGNLSLAWEDAGRYLRAPYLLPPALDLSPLRPLPMNDGVLPMALTGLPGAKLDLAGERRDGRLHGAYVPTDTPHPISLEHPPITRR
ncbi:MAG: right-handed parallel beta-helix repeat-containing protein [Burkholderiales bacterium]|nr:right-handed parallel beta-helix repeat-containing protein [Burkholderiales bacterium]